MARLRAMVNDPGEQSGAIRVVLAGALPDLDEDLLEDVFGRGAIREDPRQQAERRGREALVYGLERAGVAPPQTLRELALARRGSGSTGPHLLPNGGGLGRTERGGHDFDTQRRQAAVAQSAGARRVPPDARDTSYAARPETVAVPMVRPAANAFVWNA